MPSNNICVNHVLDFEVNDSRMAELLSTLKHFKLIHYRTVKKKNGHPSIFLTGVLTDSYRLLQTLLQRAF
jgi:hypothetical protein